MSVNAPVKFHKAPSVEFVKLSVQNLLFEHVLSDVAHRQPPVQDRRWVRSKKPPLRPGRSAQAKRNKVGVVFFAAEGPYPTKGEKGDAPPRD
tara:strand:+ start:230 stop:505 length:276 start_codon:yes stop_codon:yes gene_type:complete